MFEVILWYSPNIQYSMSVPEPHMVDLEKSWKIIDFPFVGNCTRYIGFPIDELPILRV